MKIKKLNLEEIRVSSFITKSGLNKGTIRGGTNPGYCDTIDVYATQGYGCGSNPPSLEAGVNCNTNLDEGSIHEICNEPDVNY